MSYLGGSGSIFPREILILTPPKCREMQLKLINEILKYKFSGLKKRYFYPYIDISSVLNCSTTDINPKINQEYNDFTSTAFNLTMFKRCINQNGN